MADETTSGAKVDVSIDTTKAAEATDKKKRMIKYVIIIVVIVGLYFVMKKYFMK